MPRWLHEHSLSLVLVALWFSISTFAFLISEEWKWGEYFQGLAHDAFGALVIVVCTKYFIERGSAESKDEG